MSNTSAADGDRDKVGVEELDAEREDGDRLGLLLPTGIPVAARREEDGASPPPPAGDRLLRVGRGEEGAGDADDERALVPLRPPMLPPLPPAECTSAAPMSPLLRLPWALPRLLVLLALRLYLLL